jgi:ABC-type antimicrobial peptide transport system permease subunit
VELIGGPVVKKAKKLPMNSDFDIDKAISDWIRQLKRGAALEDGAIAELEAHLRDEVEDLIDEGKSPEDAFNEVTASVESADVIGREYYKTYSRGRLATPPGSRSRFSLALFLNAIKVSFRKIRQQKWYSLISVTGLAVGIACSILILLWVNHQLSHDRFHENAEDIYRVIMEDPLSDSVSVHPWLPFPLGPALKNEFPEIAAVSRYRPDNMVVRYKERSFTETGFLTVDPTFFEIFSFPFLQGDPSEALSEPNSIVMRDTMAKKYFGNEDPIGKVLNLSGRADLTVSGVVHIPAASDFQFDFFFTFRSYPLFNVDLAPLEANWSGKNYQVYLRLNDGSSASILEEKISGFLSARTPGKKEVLRLQELSRIHLYKPDGSDGAMRYVRIFSLIAGFILLIACVNFMNLATARFEGRAKEVALRKMLGGTRGQLIRQFFSESFLHAGAALAIALLLVEFALPVFNQITLHDLSLDLFHTKLIFCLLAIVLMVGFISGLYPALFLSSFSPVRTSRTFTQIRGRKSHFRNVLIVFQFTLSTVLIVGTLVVKSQVSFIMNRELGMTKENIVYHLMQKKTRDSVAVVRDELVKNPDILSVTSCSSLPFDIQNWIGYLDWQGRSSEHRVFPVFMSVDHEFAKTIGLTLIEGRDFSRSRPADVDNFIINETACKQIGIEHPIGLELRFWGHRGQVIGVVNDFTNRQVTFNTAPMILSTGAWGANRNYLLMRLRSGNPARALKHFRQVWEKANPGFPSEYGFLDDAFERMYTNEKRLSQLLFSFAALAIFIACLGLIGLSSFKAEERTKEIGIRKVLGASSSKIMALFSIDFMKLVIIANAIAWPAGYVVMNRWLQGYAYRITIGIGIFLLAGSLGLFIALLSVGYQTVRAATANPVDSLRYE